MVRKYGVTQTVKRLLRRAGLLTSARRARETVEAVSWARKNARLWLRGAPDRLPVPPVRLVQLAMGTPSIDWMLTSGILAADSISEALKKNGVDVQDLHCILDFGCGCGRVIRRWQKLTAEIHGCDYNLKLIDWCRQKLSFATFDTNELDPPLRYRDRYFDLVYALSVFTHFTEALHIAWLKEMSRVLRPGGYLIITTHGEAYVDALTCDEQRLFQSHQLVVRDDDAPGTNRFGAYCTEQYVRQILPNSFSVLEFVAQGAKGNPFQDLFLLKRAP